MAADSVVEPSLRVAFLGKGGAGKSALAGTLCRILARRGRRVLALDGDSVPGLAPVIGVEATDDWLLAEAGERDEDKRFRLTTTPAETVERFALDGPDGIRFLQFGKVTAPMTAEERASAAAFLEVLHEFDEDGWCVVADLAAGTRQSYYGWTGIADALLVVVEPGAASLLTARRLLPLRELVQDAELLGVANKVASEAHRRRISDELERLGIPYWAEVPADPIFADADARGRPPADLARPSPALEALERVADELLSRAATRARRRDSVAGHEDDG